MNLHVFEADRVPTIIQGVGGQMTSVRVWVVSCFRRFVASSCFVESRVRRALLFLSLASGCQTRARRRHHLGRWFVGGPDSRCKSKRLLCAEIVTSGLLRNVRAGSLLCADGALARSAAAAKYPSKRLTVKHVKHVKSQWTKRANGQLEAVAPSS